MAKKTLPGHHDPEKRDYKGEYAQYHGKPEQKKRRAARNKARRRAEKAGRVSKGDGKDVHHKDGNPTNNSSKNVQVMSKEKNRGMSAPDNLKKKRRSALHSSARSKMGK